jgi:hypothetical protein
VFQDHSAGAEDSAVAFISYSSRLGNFILARLAYLEIHEMQLATPLPASNSTK